MHCLQQNFYRDLRIFYRRRTDEREILEGLTMVAEGSRPGSIFRIKGHKEDTVSDWIRDTAEHAEAVEEILMSEFRIKWGQLDGPGKQQSAG